MNAGGDRRAKLSRLISKLRARAYDAHEIGEHRLAPR